VSTTRRRFVTLSIVAAALLLIGLAAPQAEADGSKTELAVIVSADSSISELSFYELKLLYKGGKVAQPGGRALIPLNRSTKSADRVGFDRSVLGMSQREAAEYWIDRRIRGRSGAPKAVDPVDLVVKVVAGLNGAVAYVPAGSATGNDVKVLRIDGKKPGESGYRVTY